MKKNIIWIALFAIFVFSACQNKLTNDKNNSQYTKELIVKSHTGETLRVEIYLLKDFEQIEHSCVIDENTIRTEDQPFLSASDILSYNPNTYIFTISDQAEDKIKQKKIPVHGTAFALMVDNELIYTGYFYPSYSSSSCDWVIIDPMKIDYYRGLKVELGYPTLMEGMEIPDKRNDKRILNAFKNK